MLSSTYFSFPSIPGGKEREEGGGREREREGERGREREGEGEVVECLTDMSVHGLADVL